MASIFASSPLFMGSMEGLMASKEGSRGDGILCFKDFDATTQHLVSNNHQNKPSLYHIEDADIVYSPHLLAPTMYDKFVANSTNPSSFNLQSFHKTGNAAPVMLRDNDVLDSFNSNYMLELTGDPINYGLQNGSGTMDSMGAFENSSSNIPPWGFDLNCVSLSGQDTHLAPTTAQQGPSNDFLRKTSGIITMGEIERSGSNLQYPSLDETQSLIPSNHAPKRNQSRESSPSSMRPRKRQCMLLNEPLTASGSRKANSRKRKHTILNERARAILEVEFRFNPRPGRKLMQIQSLLIGYKPSEVSQWFKSMRARATQVKSNLNDTKYDHTKMTTKNPLSSDFLALQGSETRCASKRFLKIHNKSQVGNRKNSTFRKKKWHCTELPCRKLLKCKSEWIRHMNIHGQTKVYICKIPGCPQIETGKISRYRRKDKLQEHLRKHHNLVLRSVEISDWIEVTELDSQSPCGFCGEEMEDWESRLSHIADHFDKGCEISAWNASAIDEPAAMENDSETDEDEDSEESESDFDDSDEDDSDDDDGSDENQNLLPDMTPDDDEFHENYDDRDSHDSGSGGANETYNGWTYYENPSSRNVSGQNHVSRALVQWPAQLNGVFFSWNKSYCSAISSLWQPTLVQIQELQTIHEGQLRDYELYILMAPINKRKIASIDKHRDTRRSFSPLSISNLDSAVLSDIPVLHSFTKGFFCSERDIVPQNTRNPDDTIMADTTGGINEGENHENSIPRMNTDTVVTDGQDSINAVTNANHDSSVYPRDNHSDFDFPIPHKRNLDFDGREDLLNEIDNIFHCEGSCTVVLTGLGGVGKTQIAIEYAHRLSMGSRYDSILWVDAAQETTTVIQKFQKLEDLLLQKQSNWLLVIDGLENVNLFKDILAFNESRTSQNRGSIIVTTRIKFPEEIRQDKRNAIVVKVPQDSRSAKLSPDLTSEDKLIWFLIECFYVQPLLLIHPKLQTEHPEKYIGPRKKYCRDRLRHSPGRKMVIIVPAKDLPSLKASFGPQEMYGGVGSMPSWVLSLVGNTYSVPSLCNGQHLPSQISDENIRRHKIHIIENDTTRKSDGPSHFPGVNSLRNSSYVSSERENFRPGPCVVKGCKSRETYETYLHYLGHYKRAHAERAYCTIDNCTRSFVRVSDLDRHIVSIHSPPKYICAYTNATRGPSAFSRVDHFRDHIRIYNSSEQRVTPTSSPKDDSNAQAHTWPTNPANSLTHSPNSYLKDRINQRHLNSSSLGAPYDTGKIFSQEQKNHSLFHSGEHHHGTDLRGSPLLKQENLAVQQNDPLLSNLSPDGYQHCGYQHCDGQHNDCRYWKCCKCLHCKCQDCNCQDCNCQHCNCQHCKNQHYNNQHCNNQHCNNQYCNNQYCNNQHDKCQSN